MFSLISGLPSTPSASGDPPVFGCFMGTTPESDFFTACMSVVWFWAFTDRPVGWLPSGAAKISRFSCLQFLSVHGVVDYVGPKAKLALTLAFVLPSLCVYKVGALKLPFSKLSAPAHFRLCLRFQLASRLPRQDSRSEWFATPFLQDSFIPCCMPVYPGAHTLRPPPCVS